MNRRKKERTTQTTDWYKDDRTYYGRSKKDSKVPVRVNRNQIYRNGSQLTNADDHEILVPRILQHRNNRPLPKVPFDEEAVYDLPEEIDDAGTLSNRKSKPLENAYDDVMYPEDQRNHSRGREQKSNLTTPRLDRTNNIGQTNPKTVYEHRITVEENSGSSAFVIVGMAHGRETDLYDYYAPPIPPRIPLSPPDAIYGYTEPVKTSFRCEVQNEEVDYLCKKMQSLEERSKIDRAKINCQKEINNRLKVCRDNRKAWAELKREERELKEDIANISEELYLAETDNKQAQRETVHDDIEDLETNREQEFNRASSSELKQVPCSDLNENNEMTFMNVDGEDDDFIDLK